MAAIIAVENYRIGDDHEALPTSNPTPWNREMTPDLLTSVQLPTPGSSIVSSSDRLPSCPEAHFEPQQELYLRSVSFVSNCTSHVGQLSHLALLERVLRDAHQNVGHQMTRVFFVDLLSAALQFVALDTPTTGVIRVVALDFSVADKTKRDRVLLSVVASFAKWHEMVDFNIRPALTSAETTMPVTP
jgi:hypothetical protein